MRIHLLLCVWGFHDWKMINPQKSDERVCSVCRIIEHRLDLHDGFTLWIPGPTA